MARLRTQQVRPGLYLQSPRPASPFKGHQNFGNQRRNLDPPQRFTELSICLAASGEHGLERRPGMLEWRCLWNKISTPHCQQLEKIKEEDYFENCSTKKRKLLHNLQAWKKNHYIPHLQPVRSNVFLLQHLIYVWISLNGWIKKHIHKQYTWG